MNDEQRRAAAHHRQELYKCHKNATYFIDSYCQIYDASAGAWLPFRLWPAQMDALEHIVAQRLCVILKARQLGLTWLSLGFVLWLMLFRPAATILLFSRRDEEAVDLLRNRLRGLYDRLPEWLKVRAFPVNNEHEWEFSNGSRALALPTSAGDSYSATLAVVDEADLVPDLDRLLRAVKPTIDAGGRMILLSRADKTRPQSPFKRIYAAAKQGLTEWKPLFLPWQARPQRDRQWYEAQKSDIFHRTGGLDDLQEQYPGTDNEALAPRTLDKRLAPDWLEQCYRGLPSLGQLPSMAPSLPGLFVYALPRPDRVYVLGADPAEGNPTSDDSAAVVLDVDSGEEVATLVGKFQPSTFATYLDALGRWFNWAPVMCERNNHGHAVLLALGERSSLRLLLGHDQRPGWLSSSLGKALLYAAAADCFRNNQTIVHSFATFHQLASIDGSTLRAPEGQPDDRADAYALACLALEQVKRAWAMDPGEPFVIGERPFRGLYW